MSQRFTVFQANPGAVLSLRNGSSLIIIAWRYDSLHDVTYPITVLGIHEDYESIHIDGQKQE